MDKLYTGISELRVPSKLRRDAEVEGNEPSANNLQGFENLCESVLQHFISVWDSDSANPDKSLQRQKNAIIGIEADVKYFKASIIEYVRTQNYEYSWYPPWYDSLVNAIYHEIWGVAGLAEWFNEPFSTNSSSAKIIGDRIYFLESGRMVLKPQRISKLRRDKLKRALISNLQDARMNEDRYELQMLDTTRITIFTNQLVKDTEDVFVFRRYIIPRYTFEQQASRHTIPEESIPLFESMVKCGYNVAFIGAVRTAKTTFLTTWQSYEDRTLEGVMIETGPEIPLHVLMPEAPIMQIIADEDLLKTIVKPLLRSDADYMIMAEARDGIAADIVMRVANKGTRRVKTTFHLLDPKDFCYDIASEIIKSLGGELESTMVKVAKSFDYLFHFIQLSDKSQKRLKGIYEVLHDTETNSIIITEICKWSQITDTWSWKYLLSSDKVVKGAAEDLDALRQMNKTLKSLAQQYPMDDKEEIEELINID